MMDSLASMTLPLEHRRPLRLVIVEDEAIIALALQQALKSLGHHVCAVAATAPSAVTAAAEHRPDLILMDIKLQGEEDGICAALAIWSRYRIRSLFMSAFDTASTHLRALAAQPVGFLAKPYRLDDLRRTLETLTPQRIAC